MGLGTPLRFMCGPDVKLRGNGPVWQERGGTGEGQHGLQGWRGGRRHCEADSFSDR